MKANTVHFGLCYTVDWEIFVVERFSSITFNNENSTGKIFFPCINGSLYCQVVI